jgi:hypothetical protein
VEGKITVYHAVRTAVRYHSKLGDAIAGGAGVFAVSAAEKPANEYLQQEKL